MTIDQLAEKRKRWVEANRENNFEDDIKNLLTDLYPDNAHFTYELLQNAEDAGASEVQFVLKVDRLEFEHNGDRLFTIEDIESITGIGRSTKRDDPTNIGKFGIGFKSVFAYTATPEIESGRFHFRIRDMVVPDTEGLALGALGERRTHFVFPFDNRNKAPEKARAEIEKKLRGLNENTLLFLSNIRKIKYRLPDSTSGSLERRQSADDGNQIEISVMHPGNIVLVSAHYLRFEKDVEVRDEDTGELKDCRIAVAFGMDKPESGEWKITPRNPGEVCIYFPAVKETSNLRFHLHAPFASTVARDSVRECPANDELRNHLAELIAESMHAIRDQGLLNVEFLATLPNSGDNLSSFYLPIKDRLIKEFKSKKLVPMKQGGHAAASECYRGRRNLSDLIDDKDLATLLGKDPSLPLWIANPPQRNQREYNFLSMLDISDWEIKDFIEVLKPQSEPVMEWLQRKTMKWLQRKTDEWHQELYVLLGEFLSRAPSSPFYVARNRKDELAKLGIIRCSDGEYRVGSNCHFPADDIESDEDLLRGTTSLEEESPFPSQEEEKHEEEFHYVASAVYSSGNRKDQQERARKFLEVIGVRKVNEAERIKAILKRRYRKPFDPRPEDMERFIKFIETNPDQVDLFKDYSIFEVDLDRDNTRWFSTPSRVFVDAPYLDTGLTTYYEAIGEDSGALKRAISPKYAASDIDTERLGKFAEAVKAKTKLEAKKQEIPEDHRECDHLKQGSGNRTYTGINEDYRIPEFQILLTNPSIDKSKLIWQTMCSLPERYLKARFRWNQSKPLNEGHSSLVHELRKAKWIPQKDGDSISFVRPCDALRDYLPGGFPYDAGQKWLDAIEFGETAKRLRQQEDAHNCRNALIQQNERNRQNERNQRATEMGFNSADEANTMAEIANALKKQGKSPDELRDKLIAGKRRKERIRIELADAPEKQYEQRPRSVRITTGTIDRRTHLRAHYTTDDNNMECQMCRQDMPFKKRSSDEDYFEAVEALGKDHFPKEHEAQHLALCPECAAKYKEFVKRDTAAQKDLYSLLKNSDVPEVRLELSNLVICIWFEEKHWQDLKTVLDYYEDESAHENSND